MLYRYPINDAHIHVFNPDDIDEAIRMVEWCGYTHWSHLAYTGMRNPFGIVQNLLGALLKLRENGRCRAFASFDYNEGGKVPEAEELARQIEWFDKAGFDGIKMMFDYAQRTQFPILYHINDPVEFWYEEKLPQWAVKQGLLYDERFPHKYEIDEEAYGFLRKHPNMNICLAHFFFVSDQPGLCAEMFDRYPNLFFDITPGWEMFENFAKDREYWRKFFKKF